MSFFTTEDKLLQAAAVKAGMRTASQSFESGLTLIVAGGTILGATSLMDISWVGLAGALGFLALTSAFAGLRSYLNIVNNGLPTQYTEPALSK